jgi:GTP cyclohydrolase I
MAADELVRNLLTNLGEDVTREGLLDTPRRYLSFLGEFLAQKEEFRFTTFENDGSDEMIIVKDINYFSLCEHHLVPFFGTAAVAYIPNGKIVGLSKIPRTVDFFARRLQNQERITKQVADFLQEKLNPLGVAVVLTGRHMCMEMRGVQKPGCVTTTSATLGAFRDEMNTRQEFLSLLK